MKPEKMTDEELGEVETRYTGSTIPEAADVRRLLAHIAALTAERDEAVRDCEAEEAIAGAAVRRADDTCAERDALRERIQVLEAELCDAQSDARKLEAEVVRLQDEVRASNSARDMAFDAAEFARNERDALRERMQALEAELYDAHSDARKLEAEVVRLQGAVHHWEGQNAIRADQASALWRRFRALEDVAYPANATLAAIRQRAGDKDALVKVGEVCAIMGSPRAEWDDAIHEDVRQRGDVGTVRDVALGVVQYLLGEDAAGARHDALVLPGGVVLEVPPGFGLNSEPTTAEAFATVRDSIGLHEHDDVGQKTEARSALSLLERRMGAMGRAAEKVLKRMGGLNMPCLNDLRAALADAPPVFTLEEVETLEKRLRDEVPNPGAEYLSGWLDALDTFRQSLAAMSKGEVPR
jgi:prefoldin subunit 5